MTEVNDFRLPSDEQERNNPEAASGETSCTLGGSTGVRSTRHDTGDNQDQIVFGPEVLLGSQHKNLGTNPNFNRGNIVNDRYMPRMANLDHGDTSVPSFKCN